MLLPDQLATVSESLTPQEGQPLAEQKHGAGDDHETPEGPGEVS